MGDVEPLQNRWMLLAAGLAFWISVSNLAAAGRPRFTVDIFRTGKGLLPSSAVLAVTQTRDGYLWAGTLGGLARFDGQEFASFDDYNTPGLNNSRIVRLFEDSRTNLWVASDAGGVAMVQAGKVTSLDIGRGSRDQNVMAITEDTTGAIWFYTADGQLCRYREGKVDKWTDRASGHSDCRALIAESLGLLWFGTDTKLTALAPAQSSSSLGLPPTPAGMEMHVNKLDLLLASKRGGYWRLENGKIQKWKTDHLERELCAYPWTNSLSIVACEDREGNLVVGTYHDGVYWFDAEGKFERLGEDQGLSPRSAVLSVLVDREGCLWVGTNGDGLYRVRRQIFEGLECSRGFTAQSACADAQSGLWIGYNEGRVDHWTGSVTQQFVLDTNLFLSVRSVFVDRDQHVLAGTWNATGPHLFQLNGEHFQAVPGVDAIRNVSAIFQDHAGRIWLGTQGGLVGWDLQAWKSWYQRAAAARAQSSLLMAHPEGWLTYTTREGLPGDDVRAIMEDREGNLWIGTDGGGLARLRDGRFTVFTRTSGLPGDNVASLLADESDVLWVGTSHGLGRFQGGSWTRYATDQGLLSYNIGYLAEDREGYLWLGSSAGLMRLRKDSLNEIAHGATNSVPCRIYGEPDGLPGECSFGSQPGALRDRAGKLWFPTIRGLASLDPTQLHPNTNRPPVVIESVRIDGELQGTNSLRAPLPVAITVPAHKESLEITYASLNLAAPNEGRFRYRLENFETWKDRPGNIRSALYTKLPHGNYRFHVIACNEDDVWNDVGSTLSITVLPPFWQTWWFLTAVTLALLGLIVGSVHYVSTQKLQRQLATLRQQEALEKERARIARDLHDQLGANLTQVALLGELAETDKDLPDEVAAHAQQISLTARDTTRALDEIVWTVNPANDTLDGLINYVCKYAQEYLALAGLRYRLEVPSQLPATPISPELRHNVFLVMKEAVNNVVKHAHASSAWLRLTLGPEHFTFECEDDGRGISAADEKKGRNGLRNMRKRMEDIGGQFEMSPRAGGGTRVQLTAPLQKQGADRSDGVVD